MARSQWVLRRGSTSATASTSTKNCKRYRRKKVSTAAFKSIYSDSFRPRTDYLGNDPSFERIPLGE
jgi:hypothetical protein